MKEKFLKLNIQLFAEDPVEPTKEDMDDLEKEIVDAEPKVDPEPKPTNDQSPEPEKETEPETDEDPKKDPEPETDQDPEDDNEKESGIKGLRKAHEAEKKRAKELEEAKQKLEKESKTIKERLLKAIKLGIKGETEEEILANLEEYEVKDEASKKGLTEEQVRKDAQLKRDMERLSEEKQEVLFNRRAYQLQVSKGLNQNQIGEFIEKASEIGIDLLTNPSDFAKIYDSIMGTGNNEVIATKDAEIKELQAEIRRLKGEKAPEKSPDGNDKDNKDKSWEDLLAEMK